MKYWIGNEPYSTEQAAVVAACELARVENRPVEILMGETLETATLSSLVAPALSGPLSPPRPG